MKIRQIVKERLDTEYGANNYHLICIALTGSHAYGMQTKNSDHDIMGLFLPPVDYIFGLKHVEQIVLAKTEGVEGTIFDFRKWFKLMIQQNPNVLELLWHHESMYVYKDDLIWQELVFNRDLFLSKKIVTLSLITLFLTCLSSCFTLIPSHFTSYCCTLS